MLINQKVLMSGADYFNDGFAINAYMDDSVPVDVEQAIAEHLAIRHALEDAGVEVVQVKPPHGCQDGVYTANWGLCSGDTVVLSSLPNKRQDEEPYAADVLSQLGKRLVYVPSDLKFSGQGDALPCGDYLFVGSHYRTDPSVHQFLSRELGYRVVGLQTVPTTDKSGKPIINPVTGWPDSFFYDLDLALAVLTPTLIAWCPEAFTPESQAKIRAITDLEKIEVSYEEATKGFACNLVSTGETVIMSANAPLLTKAVEARGLKTITPAITELAKGGGYIRCTTLTLD
jgi:N-dimethylarginine dimethylaminohydrolase